MGSIVEQSLPNLFILNILSKYIPTENIEVDTVYDDFSAEYHILLKIPNMKCQLTITKRTKWVNMKRYIDKLITRTICEDCEICYNTMSTTVSCNECYNIICVDCCYNTIKSNNGILFKCPFCRYEQRF